MPSRHIGIVIGVDPDIGKNGIACISRSRRKPDITLAKKMLRWEPKVKLEEGLRRTIEYFKEDLL